MLNNRRVTHGEPALERKKTVAAARAEFLTQQFQSFQGRCLIQNVHQLLETNGLRECAFRDYPIADVEGCWSCSAEKIKYIYIISYYYIYTGVCLYMFGHVSAHVCWFSCVYDLNLTSFDAQNSTIPCPWFVRSWVADCSNTSALPVQHAQPFGAMGIQIPNKWGVSWSYTHWVSQPDSPHWVNGSKIALQ